MTRRRGALTVLLVSQLPTLVILTIVVLALKRWPAPGAWLLAGGLAGVVGLVGLAALYEGMAVGVVSVVATIAATAPVIPLVVGLAIGERPSALQLAGIGVALAGVLLLTFDHRDVVERRLLPGVGLALLAALAFGFFLVAVRYASRPDPLAGVLAVRIGSAGTLLVIAALFRSSLQVRARELPTLLVVGALDTGADVLFAVATTLALLSVVSILASLYPVATVVLARIFLHERPAGAQLAGIVLAFTGVLLISL